MKLKILICLSCFIFFAQNSWAAKAVVTVLEAPLLQYPDDTAIVLQLKRKGDEIYIHGNQLSKSTDSVNYNVDRYGIPQEEKVDKSKYYKTLTRDGTDAYIAKKYVKVAYQDVRELNQRVSITDLDPTDYRLEEPLPKGYPLFEDDHSKILVMYGIGPSNKTGYLYSSNFDFESYSSRQGLSIIYANKVKFDKTNRFYFGGEFQLFTQDAEYLFVDDRLVKENHSEIGVGPYISYDTYRSDDYRITFGGGLIVNYHRSLVSQRATDGTLEEERLFSGFTITPKISSYFAWIDMVPEASIDLIVGAEALYRSAYSLTTSPLREESSYWSDSDQIDFKSTGLFSLYIGFQANY